MAKTLISSKPSTKKREDIKVFISLRDSKCDECGEELGRKAWITLEENKGALCLACADLDELVFLPSGDAALTRRARKHSVLSAVVLKFSKARGRYERQGLLVEESALDEAEAECLADAEARERRAERERERRAELDQSYVEQFAKRIRELFPACPAERELQIAEHACRKIQWTRRSFSGGQEFRRNRRAAGFIRVQECPSRQRIPGRTFLLVYQRYASCFPIRA